MNHGDSKTLHFHSGEKPMKAIAFSQYGSPDVLQLKEVSNPVPKDNEVLIEVCASSINSWDWEFLSGTLINRLFFGLFKPKQTKHILGADIAGIVTAVGKDVSRFQPGDEVFGDLWDNWGGFAEYACAPETALALKPQNLTFEQAAAVPQAGVLALQGLRKANPLQPGQKVLVNGAGGGVGTFAIQLAKLADAEVTGVDAPHKLEVVRSLGADHVLDYTRKNFTKTGARYDLIVDCQNWRSMFDNKRALAAGGTYAMIGGSILRVYQLWFLSFMGQIMSEDKRLCLVAEGPNKGLAELKDLLEASRITPVIDSIYPFHEVPEALRHFGEGHHQGKIVITMKS